MSHSVKNRRPPLSTFSTSWRRLQPTMHLCTTCTRCEYMNILENRTHSRHSSFCPLSIFPLTNLSYQVSWERAAHWQRRYVVCPWPRHKRTAEPQCVELDLPPSPSHTSCLYYSHSRCISSVSVFIYCHTGSSNGIRDPSSPRHHKQ